MALETIDEMKRSAIKTLLQECNEKQFNLFNRIYPKGVDGMEKSKLDWAYEQCRRTVENNRKKWGVRGEIEPPP